MCFSPSVREPSVGDTEYVQMQLRPMSATYIACPPGERSALCAPCRSPPKSITDPSSRWEAVVSTNERSWRGRIVCVVLAAASRAPLVVVPLDWRAGDTIAPVLGSRLYTSPVAPPAEYSATSLAATYPLRDLVGAVLSKRIDVGESTA